jgi:hypothetical protein
VSAGLDALDRGVIEAGVMAAEALARVEAAERRIEALSAAICAAYAHAGLDVPAGLPTPRRRPDLRLVKS